MWSAYCRAVCYFSPDEFAKTFNENFVDSNNLSHLVNTFVCDIKDNMNDDYYDVIFVSEIEEAVKSLNLSKAYDYKCLTVEHIVNVHPAVYMVLKYLFSAILHHGVVPNDFGLSLIMPTVKNKSKPAADILNYRLINIMPLVTKIFEKCLISRLDLFFKFHDNQYGFVLNGGCDKALFAVHGEVSNFRQGLLGIQIMLDTCICVADQFGLVFSFTKSYCGFFYKSVAGLPKKIMMYGRYLDWSSELLYLRIFFKCGAKMSVNAASRISKFIGTICSVLRDKMVGFEDLCFS